ncbi:MAG: asparagine synthase (glutamine-hydrolyzing) [Patescibacteria group bacterium]
MCGIAGSINFKEEPVSENLLKTMTETMVHRGPDDSGYFRDAHVALGFRRLSIIDLGGGKQPMSNEDNTIWVVFNGEIYNFQELRNQLLAKDHVFKTKSDTEVIVHAYEEWGDRCMERFCGMFAYALYDQKQKKVIFARDRLGVKPLYYAWVDGQLLFGSEMKAILAHPKFDRAHSLSALSSYLTFRYPQGAQPVFANMKRLEPGHYLVVTPTSASLTKYWDVPFFARKEDFGEYYYLERIGELLTKAVQRRMISDVPIGMYLSGGLDSSIVAALMSGISPTPVETFSIGFPEDKYNETDAAQFVARHCDTNHHALLLPQENYLELLPKVIRIKDAPLSIPHEIALYQLSCELKKYVTVALSGEGSDELFGGYGRVQRSPMDWKKIQFVQRYVPQRMRQPVIAALGAGTHADQWLAIPNAMEHLFSVYNWISFKEKWSLFSDEVNEALAYDEQEKKAWAAHFDLVKDGDPYDQVLYLFEKRHLLCLLDRLDAMSMAASVEARVPFVDHELVEFVSTIPSYYKLRWRSPLHKARALFTTSFSASERLDQSKDILRRYARTLLPSKIVDRKKLGFPVPLDAWMKQGLAAYAKEILLDERSRRRGIFNTANLEKLMNNQQPLDYDFWGKKIFMILNIELWFRMFVDKNN